MLTLRRFSPEPLASFIDRLDAFDWRFNGDATWTPAVDVVQEAEATRVTAEIPGFKPDQVHVTIEGNLLTIRGTKGDLTFERAFTIPASVNSAAITANYEHGILTVTLPKAEQARARQIPVAVAKS